MVDLLRGLTALPPLAQVARRSLAREQVTELTLPAAFAMMEGGFVGVIADKVYAVPPWVLAVITAAPMFGNLSSYLWNRLANARRKVPVIVALQMSILACLLAVAASPTSAAGAWILVLSVVASRLLMAGIITVRSVIWSLNYGRAVRARATGRLQVITSLVTVITSALAGAVLDAEPGVFRWVYATGAAIGVIGVIAFSGVPVIGEPRHRVLERRNRRRRADSQVGFFQILRNDKRYARYQTYQFIAGSANMCIEAPLIYLVSRQLEASYSVSIAMTLIIPFGVSVVTLPLWAIFLDRVHVAEFRARQSLLWIVSQLVTWAGAFMPSLAVLGVGRFVLGVARGGGSLAWQIGHNDFARPNELSAYMGVHVTLTGIRGAIAPFLGIALYLGWDASALWPAFDGIGPHLFALAAALSGVAGIGFYRLHRDMKRGEAHSTS